MSPLLRGGAAVSAAVAFCAALWLAAMHPLAPAAVLAGVWLVAAGTAWRPAGWLFWLPALMPVLNFFPWSGWWLVDESDLFVLAVLAGGYGRWAWAAPVVGRPAPPRWWGWAVLGLAFCVAQALWRGWLNAPPLPPHTGWGDAFRQGLYADHLSAWNSVRVAKSFVWALLLAPLAWRAVAADRQAAGLAFVRGMVAGLALVGVLVLWERDTQVGLLDFVSGYRTSAAFWEMHVGGGAIDAYLALAAPLALWAVWMAPTRTRWWLALGLLWLTIYGLLTTYSRGVLLAFAIVVCAWALAARVFHLPHDGHGPGRRRVVAATLLGLLLQGALVGSGAMLEGRFGRTTHDLVSRWNHWQQGLGLLQPTLTVDSRLWWGLGMGRFTAHYRVQGPDGELPGQAVWAQDAQGQGLLVLSGPDSQDDLALQFGLTQRVSLREPVNYTVRLRLAGQPGDEVLVTLCQRHLLHPLICQWESAKVPEDDAAGERWQVMKLGGYPMPVAGGGPLPAVLALHAMQAGQHSQVRSVQLTDGSGRPLLQNSDFSAGLAHWMPAAEAYFLPWHIDNLYLDLLLELGAVGWVLLATLTSLALVRLVRGLRQRDALAWAYGAAMLGFLAVGAVISVTEIPRVLLLALLTMTIGMSLWTERRPNAL